MKILEKYKLFYFVRHHKILRFRRRWWWNKQWEFRHATSIQPVLIVYILSISLALDINEHIHWDILEIDPNERRQITGLISVGKVLERNTADIMSRIGRIVLDLLDVIAVRSVLALTLHIDELVGGVCLGQIARHLGRVDRQPAVDAVQLEQNTWLYTIRQVTVVFISRTRRTVDVGFVVVNVLFAMCRCEVLRLAAFVFGEEEIERLVILLVLRRVDFYQLAFDIDLYELN